MGLRQPSKVQTFFAQAAAGTQQQAQAREKLKKPQALGGSAAAGTAMVAATTQAQQAQTAKVGEAAQSASKDLVAKVPTSQTAAVITGQPATPAQTAAPGIAANVPAATDIMKTAESGDMAAVESTATAINANIDNITNQINDLNDKLRSASAADAAAINIEKDRLTKLLTEYQDKVTKENLGQIAGPSTFETEMEAQQRVLAEEGGGNIGKLKAAFGSRWTPKYGGLQSQIYGKDIENIQEQAAAGLRERERSKIESEAALGEYGQTIERGKKGYEETLDTESKKLDILKSSPEQLSTMTKVELEKLFGADKAAQLFEFNAQGTVSGTKTSKVRQALEDARKAAVTEQGKIESAKQTAKNKKVEEYAATYFPRDKYGTPLGNPDINKMKQTLNSANSTVEIYPELGPKLDQYKLSLANIENQLRNAVKRADKNEIDKALGLINTLRDEWKNDVGAAINAKTKSIIESDKKREKERNQTMENIGRGALAVATGGVSEIKPVRQAASWAGSKVKSWFK